MSSKVEKRSSREEKRWSRNPKAAMEAEAINLISTVTDIERDEENFEICERFVLSNLLYHKFLDPDELKVKSSLKGLTQKFKIHAQPEKAGHLEDLLAKYSGGEVFTLHGEAATGESGTKETFKCNEKVKRMLYSYFIYRSLITVTLIIHVTLLIKLHLF